MLLCTRCTQRFRIIANFAEMSSVFTYVIIKTGDAQFLIGMSFKIAKNKYNVKKERPIDQSKERKLIVS